jgi:hypothetical protein
MEKESDAKPHGQTAAVDTSGKNQNASHPTLKLPPLNGTTSDGSNTNGDHISEIEEAEQKFFRNVWKWLVDKIFPKNMYIQTFLKKGPAIIGLISIAGVGGYIAHPSTPTINYRQVVEIGYVHYGVIRDVTIISAYPYSINGKSMQFCNVEYTLERDQKHDEVLKDIDEGPKTNSSDIFLLCQKYAMDGNTPNSGKPVTLVVSGIRDTPTSSFRNILRFIPQDS